jgi:hypothetical protein
MGRQTVTQYTCDAKACGKVLARATDGLVIHGHVAAPGSGEPVIVTPGQTPNAPAMVVLCWAHWHRLVEDSVLAEAREELRACQERTQRERDNDRNGDGWEAGQGPAPPPELPRAVAVAAALAGAGR